MAGALLIVAHPDDEFFCAGALAALRKKNIPVTVAYWTCGEGGYRGRFKKYFSCLPTFFRPRAFEARASLRSLGISRCFFLGYNDPSPGGGLKAPRHEPETFRSELKRFITRMRPELVLTHGPYGEYGHPAHILLHTRIAEVVREEKHSPGMVTFSGFGPDRNLKGARYFPGRSDAILDSLPYAAQKREVLEAHASQKNIWQGLVPETGGSLQKMVELSRYEYYNCGILPSLENSAELFREWTGAGLISLDGS